MLKNDITIQHVNVTNATDKYEKQDFIPDIIVTLNYKDRPELLAILLKFAEFLLLIDFKVEKEIVDKRMQDIEVNGANITSHTLDGIIKK